MVKKAGCGGSFDGLCCRMVIETKRVFDGCEFTDNNITLTLTTVEALPADAEFVSARVVDSEFVSYTITDGTERCKRVAGEIITRFAVTYSSGGNCFTVPATLREQREVLLRLPNEGIVPYAIEVQAQMIVGSGAIIGTNAVSVSGCFLRIIKVTAPVDILIPTYGYCVYPPCTGCACSGFTSDPQRIFPSFTDDSNSDT